MVWKHMVKKKKWEIPQQKKNPKSGSKMSVSERENERGKRERGPPLKEAHANWHGAHHSRQTRDKTA